MVHFVKIAVNGLNEVVVNFGGNFGRIKGSCQSAGIFSCIGEEAKLLELSVQSCSDGVFVLTKAVVIGFKYLFTEIYITAFKKRNKRTVGKLVLNALGVGYGGEF